MKHLLFVLFLIPVLVLGQERQQKLNLRNGGSPAGTPNSSFSNPRSFDRPSIGEFQQKQIERDRAKQSYNHRPGSNVYLYDPYWNGGWGWNDWYWGPNRWYRWGAPMWYNSWEPWFYYDNWGYRQPARIYIRDGGKVDTIRGVKLRMTIGLQANTDELGGFFTIGNKTLFIAEYQHRYQRDRSVFYSDLTRDVVIPWDDRRLDNIVKGGTLFLGLGQRFGRTSAFGALGIVGERNRYQYYDELFILSNNGNYSFPNYRDKFLAIKLGILQDIKSATIKADYEPTRNLITFGLGVNF